jgi:Plavaka transposase
MLHRKTKVKCLPLAVLSVMESLLEPLKKVGENGMEITCADRWVCRVYTILAAYMVCQHGQIYKIKRKQVKY